MKSQAFKTKGDPLRSGPRLTSGLLRQAPCSGSRTAEGVAKAVPVASCDNREAELQEGRYFLRITRRLRRGRSLRPRGGSGSLGPITSAFSLL